MQIGTVVIIWLALVLLFVIIEIMTLGLTSIWFAAGALVSALAAMFGAPVWLQVILFIVVSAVLLACTRKFAVKHLNNRLEKTNAESLVGKQSIVIETIDNVAPSGKIRIGDVEWTARSVTDGIVIPKDQKVVIREISGVKCMVEPVDGTSTETTAEETR